MSNIEVLRKNIVQKLDEFDTNFKSYSKDELLVIIGDLIDYIDESENDYNTDERDIFDVNEDKLYKIREIVNLYLYEEDK